MNDLFFFCCLKSKKLIFSTLNLNTTFEFEKNKNNLKKSNIDCSICEDANDAKNAKNVKKCKLIHFRMHLFDLIIKSIQNYLKLIILIIDNFFDFDVHHFVHEIHQIVDLNLIKFKYHLSFD